MKVKICGITDLESALTAIESGADALGFVFAESKRKIDPLTAFEIISQLPREVLKVGVFVNESVENINKIIEKTGITSVQLHGDETPEFCTSFSVPVIKALSISETSDIERINGYHCDYILLDSPKGKYHGGNGTKFNWNLLSEVERPTRKIILAGGLNIENVAEAIEITYPYMVDVSSGVETNGKKDIEKIRQFIRAAKQREEIK
ncbi:phosphoribosylanthranilate isomerase [Cytobacillus sp. FJAT-54145]|uniref:N-(5'-phosphoribosyl)anthranilate isomerase n=1 Tax=Cytobacillus spartinae TaxID=3299023 RepID=A0ABW6KEX7_9BACI